MKPEFLSGYVAVAGSASLRYATTLRGRQHPCFLQGIFNGLIVAEIELPSADTKIVIPDWIACEVTGNPAFNNHRMAKFVAEDDGIFNYVDYFYENVIDTLARK